MAGKDLTITLTAKDGTSTVFKQVGTEAERMGQKVTTASDKSSASMKKWTETGKALGLGLASVGLIASKIAGDAEASTARMTTAFQNVGLSVDDFQAKIDDLTKTGLKLAFDDEDVQDALAELITTTGNAEKAMRDVGVAEDLARAKGISLAAATDIVNAAEAGRFRGLQQLGIQLDANATSEEAIAALQGRVAGQADAYSKTTAASYERMKNSVENYLESVGGFVNANGQVIFALGGIATAAGPATAGIKAFTAAVKESELIGGASSFLGASAAATGLAAALGTIGVVTASLAAPIGITTYLFIDQKNVMADATEETLKNRNALEGYINYLNSIDVKDAVLPQMTQQAKELLDWVTKVGDEIDTGLIQNAPGTAQWSTNLGALGVTLQSLNPQDLQVVIDLAQQWGIVFGDPSTWNPDAINAVSNAIVTLANEEGTATYNTLELARAQGTVGVNLVQAGNAAVSTAFDIQSLTAQVTNMSAAVSEDTWLQGQLASGLAKSTSGLNEVAGAAATAGSVNEQLIASLKDLNAELTDTGAEGLDRYMDMIVGFTDSIVDSTGNAKKWADNLIAPVGVYSELDNLLANGKITLDQYNAAQQAQIDITNDDARAQAARNQIQAEQAPLIAQQSDAAADYIEKLAGMTAGEQELALAYADPAQSKRITDIADMAAGYHDMTDAQKEAFGETVTSAAAADSSLAAVLQSLGLIKVSTTDPSGWEINMDTVNSQTAMDTLVSTLQDLVTTLAGIYKINIDHSDADATSGLLATIGGQIAGLDGQTANLYVNTYHNDVQMGGVGKAIGGVVNFATGGTVHLAELGPEMLRYPSGAIGMAYREGNYVVPNGTHVDTASATASTLNGGRANRQILITGPVYITPATPDLHDAIASTVLRGGL